MVHKTSEGNAYPSLTGCELPILGMKHVSFLFFQRQPWILDSKPWIPGSRYWIPDFFFIGILSLVGFWIPLVSFAAVIRVVTRHATLQVRNPNFLT